VLLDVHRYVCVFGYHIPTKRHFYVIIIFVPTMSSAPNLHFIIDVRHLACTDMCASWLSHMMVHQPNDIYVIIIFMPTMSSALHLHLIILCAPLGFHRYVCLLAITYVYVPAERPEPNWRRKPLPTISCSTSRRAAERHTTRPLTCKTQFI
jgi:hypothetical protein